MAVLLSPTGNICRWRVIVGDDSSIDIACSYSAKYITPAGVTGNLQLTINQPT